MATGTAHAETLISLARVDPFQLGVIEVNPATRELIFDGESEIVEPRVMQVLVALAEVPGRVVSRDELITRCWDGRIVGDNAINRVISQIRRLAADFARSTFEVETITKVGYRLNLLDRSAEAVPDRPAAPAAIPDDPVRSAANPSRRRLLASAAALAGIGAIGWAGWRQLGGHQPLPEAVALYRRAHYAQRQGNPEQVRQAVALFQQATEVDPLYADAWGGLALAYRHMLEGYAEGDTAAYPGLIQSAARRALALDPDNGDGQLALVITPPHYRNWLTIEPKLARLAEEHEGNWFVHAMLGSVRYETGRWTAGLPHTERMMELEPFAWPGHLALARCLWSLGRLQEAEAVLDRAVEQFPGVFQVWSGKFHFLLLTDRPGAAAAFVMNPENRPDNLRPAAIDIRTATARAFDKNQAGDVAVAVGDARSMLSQGGAGVVPLVGPILLHFGLLDEVFGALDQYYFGGPATASLPAEPPPRWFDRRSTVFLFTPPFARLRRDPRFEPLLVRVGLEDYWRRSATRPDFRA